MVTGKQPVKLELVQVDRSGLRPRNFVDTARFLQTVVSVFEVEAMATVEEVAAAWQCTLKTNATPSWEKCNLMVDRARTGRAVLCVTVIRERCLSNRRTEMTHISNCDSTIWIAERKTRVITPRIWIKMKTTIVWTS